MGDQNSERQWGIGLSLLPLERRGSWCLGPSVPACSWLRAASGVLTAQPVQPASAQGTRSLSQEQPQAGDAGVSARNFLAWMVSRDAEETWAGPTAADAAPGSPGPFQTHNFLLYNVSKLGLDAPP